MDQPDIKKVLKANVEALMTYFADRQRGKTMRTDAQGVRWLAGKAKISPGSVGRIFKAKTSVGIDIVDKVARAFKLRAYQLLIPELDPANPAWIPATKEEKRIAKTVRLVSETLDTEGAEGAHEETNPDGRSDHDGIAHHRGAGLRQGRGAVAVAADPGKKAKGKRQTT